MDPARSGRGAWGGPCLQDTDSDMGGGGDPGSLTLCRRRQGSRMPQWLVGAGLRPRPVVGGATSCSVTIAGARLAMMMGDRKSSECQVVCQEFVVMARGAAGGGA